MPISATLTYGLSKDGKPEIEGKGHVIHNLDDAGKQKLLALLGQKHPQTMEKLVGGKVEHQKVPAGEARFDIWLKLEFSDSSQGLDLKLNSAPFVVIHAAQKSLGQILATDFEAMTREYGKKHNCKALVP